MFRFGCLRREFFLLMRWCGSRRLRRFGWRLRLDGLGLAGPLQGLDGSLVKRIITLRLERALDGSDGELAKHVEGGEQLLILSDYAVGFSDANGPVEVEP